MDRRAHVYAPPGPEMQNLADRRPEIILYRVNLVEVGSSVRIPSRQLGKRDAPPKFA